MSLSQALRSVMVLDRAEAVTPLPTISLPTISVIGLGYVGVVSVGCFAARGFTVIGVDLDKAKVAVVASGHAPIVEKGLAQLIAQGFKAQRIQATDDIHRAVLDSDVTLLAVGTPTGIDGGCDLTCVRSASRAIGEALAHKSSYHCVILRCSVPPGTTQSVVVPEIEAASGKTLGRDFGVCFSPEFLREGSAIADFDAPSKIVLAASDARAEAVARQLLASPGQPILVTTMPAAETVKYVDNIWHAAKVVFANEVGRFCKPLDVDSHEVMRLFVADTKLNLSPYYLRPGFAFGGSCLPKEVRAAMHIGAQNAVRMPLIESLLLSNEQQIADAHKLIAQLMMRFDGQTVGILGLTFKSGTDDLRESPMLELMARLQQDRMRVRIYDPNLQLGQRLSAQAKEIRLAHAHLAPALDALETGGLLDTLPTVMNASDVVVVAHETAAIRTAVQHRRGGVHVVDLIRLFAEVPGDATYHGFSW